MVVCRANIKTILEVDVAVPTLGLFVDEAVSPIHVPAVRVPAERKRRDKGDFIVDGGVYNNFPAWLLTPAGDRHWPAQSRNAQRIKIGISLDETQNAPRNWQAAPPKFVAHGDPAAVDLLDVVKLVIDSLLVGWLRDLLKATPPQTAFDKIVADITGYRILEVAFASLTAKK